LGLPNGQHALLACLADAEDGAGGLNNAAEHGTSFLFSQVATPRATGLECISRPVVALELIPANQALAWKPIIFFWERWGLGTRRLPRQQKPESGQGFPSTVCTHTRALARPRTGACQHTNAGA
jgi:hypothetical protein